MAASGYESILCVKNEVFVYKIPPRPSNRGYRASEWKLDAPDWTGRLKVVAINKDLFIKLEDKSSGELFAQCPVEMYPSIAVESVMDSSRYFVIRIKDPSGRSAFIGIGFADRSDSFDLNVSLQDHFKWIKQEKEAEQATTELTQGPKLDLGFKAGQTITLNIGSKKGDAGARSKPKPRATGVMLPPPPGSGGGGGIKLPPPSGGGGGGGGGLIAPPSHSSVGTGAGSSPAHPPPPAPSSQSQALGLSSNMDLLLDLAPSPSQPSAPAPLAAASVSGSGSGSAPPASQPTTTGGGVGDLWGDFAGANNGSDPSPPASTGSIDTTSNAVDWVQF